MVHCIWHSLKEKSTGIKFRVSSIITKNSHGEDIIDLGTTNTVRGSLADPTPLDTREEIFGPGIDR